MRLSLRRSAFGLAFATLLVGGLPAQANPVLVGPPPMVDGQPAPLPTVKKWGQYWYPASLVGHNRGIAFAFDHASNTLYADGSVLDLDTLVVDGVVYIPLQPEVSGTDWRPGQTMLEARRAKYEAMEQGMPEKQGNTEMLFMESTVDVPAHPWAEAPTYQPTGPIIDLDPTGSGQVPAHMQPNAQAPVARTGPLPGRMPRPSDLPPVDSEPSLPAATPAYPGAEGGIPLRISTAGGPQATAKVEAPVTLPPIPGPTTAPPSPQPAAAGLTPGVNPNGLQPIPKTPTVMSTQPFAPGTSAFGPSKGKNQAFEVSVLGGSLQSNSSDRLLALKLHQKNLSPVAQANLGSFALRCKDGSRVEPVKSRSVMPDGTLAPGGVREGELLFRLSPGAQPAALELEGTLPLSVSLGR